MRFFLFAACLCLAAPVRAAGDIAMSTNADLVPQAERIDRLFDALKREADSDSASGIADRISREWRDSGSPTVNLLLWWADTASTDDRNAAALDFLDEAISLRPGYAEAWNLRATLHYKMGNLRKAMSDINRVLALEPRHFGAIAGMAAILSDTGRDTLALGAWERFLAVYPSERRAQKALDDLSEKLTGQRT